MKTNYRPHNGLLEMIRMNPQGYPTTKERFRWCETNEGIIVYDREIESTPSGYDIFAMFNKETLKLSIAGQVTSKQKDIESGIKLIRMNMTQNPDAAKKIIRDIKNTTSWGD